MSTPEITRKLRLVSTGLLICILAFTIYWSAELLSFAVPMVFTDQINTSRFIEDGVEATILMRALFGALWFATYAVALSAAFEALGFMWRIRSGQYFSEATARSMQTFGLLLASSMIMDTILAMFQRSVLTMANAPYDSSVAGSIGQIAPRYIYDPGDITVFLCGMGFFVVGWLLKEGGRIEDEFKAII